MLRDRIGEVVEDLELVGYTADLEHLVVSEAAGDGRFRLPVDEGLLSTLMEVANLAGPTSPLAPLVGQQPSRRAAERSAPPPGTGTLVAAAVVSELGPPGEARPEQPANGQSPDSGSRASKLSPRQIQALLRAGKAPRTIARQAGTEEAWVRRWLPPIEAEREQVLKAVHQSRVSKARLGPSRDLVGEAVRKNLSDKGLEPNDETVRWSASRRQGDERWTVELRYRSRGRSQRAVWRFDPESGELETRNALATEIAWTRPRAATGRRDSDANGAAGRGRDGADGTPDGRGRSGGRGEKKASAGKGGKSAAGRRGTAKAAKPAKAAGKRGPAKAAKPAKAAGKRGPAKAAKPAKAAGKRGPAKAAKAAKPAKAAGKRGTTKPTGPTAKRGAPAKKASSAGTGAAAGGSGSQESGKKTPGARGSRATGGTTQGGGGGRDR